MLNLEVIARVCNTVIRNQNKLLGDDSIPEWDKLSEDLKRSNYIGIQYVIDNPEVTPQEIHATWCKTRIDSGWIFGDTKCDIKKTHPCLVSFEELPIEQQIKDELFISTVKSFL